jgi:hypothetical protein
MKELNGFTRNSYWLRRRLFTETLKFVTVQKLEINFRVCPQF